MTSAARSSCEFLAAQYFNHKVGESSAGFATTATFSFLGLTPLSASCIGDGAVKQLPKMRPVLNGSFGRQDAFRQLLARLEILNEVEER